MEPPFTDSDLQAVFTFTVELDRLKAVLRRTKPVGLDRYENSAEHSWHVCVLAMLLARRAAEPVDLPRVLELLLVHDVPEIDCGDQIVYAATGPERAAAEAAAAERVFGLLPRADAERLRERWREFDEQRTPEARFALAMDRLMPVLHNLYGDARSWRENAIPRERVKAVNSVIAAGCPDVWRQVEPAIDLLFAQRVDGRQA
jgi:putative hydrolases of HD superfamily